MSHRRRLSQMQRFCNCRERKKNIYVAEINNFFPPVLIMRSSVIAAGLKEIKIAGVERPLE